MSRNFKDLRGLGDLVEVITDKTGIKSAVKAITESLGIEDCGCDNRQEKLNVYVPFNRGTKQDK